MQALVRTLQKLNWSIRRKIGLAFGVVLICFIINGSISLLLLFNIKDAQEQQDGILNNLARLERYQQAYNNEVNLYADSIVLTSSRLTRDSYKEIIVAELGKRDSDEDRQDFETRFAELYSIAFDHFNELSDLIARDRLPDALVKWQKFKPDFDAITTLLGEWRTQLETDRGWGSSNVNNAILLSVTMISCVTLGSILLGIFLLLLIERVLVRPIRALEQGLNNLAKGDLGQQLEIHNRDEVGRLAQSFKIAVVTLQQVINGVQISESLRAVTGQLALVSREQASGSNQQVSALTQVMAAMQELGQTAGRIAESAVQVAGLTGTTLEQIERVAQVGSTSQEKSHQMVEVVQATLNGVERVGRQVEEFQRSMRGLNVQTEAIIKVVGLLGSIAGEVHLLALNAAIEAAGAGQYGERFRQVARQIKELANRSNKATQEARLIITEVQASSRRALTQVEAGQAEIYTVIQANGGLRQSLEELEQSAQQVAEAVSYLLALAEQVSDRAELIKQATFQQRVSSEQVLVSAACAEEVAEQTAATTHQIARSSSQLENLTNQLSGVLKSYLSQ